MSLFSRFIRKRVITPANGIQTPAATLHVYEFTFTGPVSQREYSRAQASTILGLSGYNFLWTAPEKSKRDYRWTYPTERELNYETIQQIEDLGNVRIDLKT